MNNRAKILGVEGVLSVELLRDCILSCSGQCEWCGKRIVHEYFEVDHIISLSHQGKNTTDNLAVACMSCNRAKSNKHPARFAAEIAAQSGQHTQLVNRILNQHALGGLVQKSLFDTLDTNPSNSDDNSNSVKPYNWSQ